MTTINRMRKVGASVLLAAAVAITTAMVADQNQSPDELTQREARLPLADTLAETDLVGFEPIGPDRFPNYVRMMGLLPDGGPAMANLARSILYDGHVEPEIKMAMGLAISQETNARYTAAHMRRLLGANERGRSLLEAVETGSGGKALSSPADRLALAQGIALTHDVNGLDDARFAELRSHYNERQIVELTLVACFFSYFNRMVEAINIPLEPWALSSADERIVAGSYAPPSARIGLLENEEVAMIVQRLERDAPGGAESAWDGVEIVNSVRAMARSSDIRAAAGDIHRSRGARGAERYRAIQFHESLHVGARPAVGTGFDRHLRRRRDGTQGVTPPLQIVRCRRCLSFVTQ